MARRRPISTREAIKRLTKTGCEIRYRGHMVVSHPALDKPYSFNQRRKDAPMQLLRVLTKIEQYRSN